MKRLLPRRRSIAAVFLAVAVAAIMFRQPLLTATGQWLDDSTRLKEPVDYVMILGGGATTRPFVAAEILHAGLAKKALVQTFKPSEDVLDGIEISEDVVIREVLIRSGISPEAVIAMDGAVDSTHSEAECLARFLKQHPGTTAAVITSDFHTRRTRLLIAQACGDQAELVSVIGAPTDGYDARNWWQSEGGLVCYVSEYLKLLKTYAGSP